MKKSLCINVLAGIFFCSSGAHAELIPKPGSLDPRVRVVEYTAGNVIRLVTYYGVSTHIQFAAGEVIRDIAIGDEKAWNVVPRANNLFIKPKELKADTNVTIITDKRVYHFALMVQQTNAGDKAWRDPNLIFSLSFRYPEDQVAKLAVNTEVLKSKLEAQEVSNNLASAKRSSVNTDYWVAGSNEVSPTAARDDGRFTYLTFSNNRDMPAVYSVDESGAEALINTNVEHGNTIVVHRVVRKLVLRKGSAVVCVINKAYDMDGTDNTTGTVSPSVERFIKEGGRE